METMEEIVVQANKSLVHLRRELHEAEEVVFKLFNSMNSDDKFDIHCDKVAPTGSHIRRRVCKPNYVRELTAEATSQWLLAGPGQIYVHPVARIRQQDEFLRLELEVLVVERPDLATALSALTDAKQILESERQRRCDGRIISCQR